MGGGGEGGGDLFQIARPVVRREVAWDLRMKLRRAVLVGVGSGGYRRQRIDVDRDRLRGIARLVRRLRDDERHRLADMQYALERQGTPLRPVHRRAVPVLDRNALRHRLEAGRRQVGTGVDAEHARHRGGRLRVDRADDPVRVAAPDHGRVGLAGKVEIVGVLPATLKKGGILFSARPLPDAELDQVRFVGIEEVHLESGFPLTLRGDARIAATTASPISSVPTRFLPGSKMSAVR